MLGAGEEALRVARLEDAAGVQVLHLMVEGVHCGACVRKIERALDALGRVSDPEIGESIVELGLVEKLEITPARIELALVLTSPTCPMGDAIADEAWQALQQAFPGREVVIEEAQGVAWDPSRLSEGARERLGWNDEQA